jgi:hypothetical protein
MTYPLTPGYAYLRQGRRPWDARRLFGRKAGKESANSILGAHTDYRSRGENLTLPTIDDQVGLNRPILSTTRLIVIRRGTNTIYIVPVPTRQKFSVVLGPSP